jgi:DNA-binding winged helix-turn-helix (wHTH) protein
LSNSAGPEDRAETRSFADDEPMNQLFSPPGRRVDLALEPPFALGSLRVRPNALEVHGPDGVQTLEPRVMQVLVALHQAREEPVSRDALCELCWEGRVVGEDALNRCVGRLRKALAVEPRAAIDTIPKIGYRLRVSSAERTAPGALPEAPSKTLPEAFLASTAPASAPRRAPRIAVLAAAGLAAIAVLSVGAAAWSRLGPSAAWSAEGMRPLTAEPGVEDHPALSPDGRFLVYAAGPGFYGQRDLFLKSVNEGAPLRLTSDPADETASAWAPSGDRIAFIRQSGEEPCRVVVLPVPGGSERTVGRCTLARLTGLAWLDEDTVLLADRSSPNEVRRIRALDVATGAVRILSRPGPETLGDGEPLPSPDGRSIVFRRYVSNGVQVLYLADARTGAERALTRDGWKALSYAWAPDGRTLFYTTNRGGDFGLWSLDTRGVSAGRVPEPKRVSLGLLNFGRMSADRSGRLAGGDLHPSVEPVHRGRDGRACRPDRLHGSGVGSGRRASRRPGVRIGPERLAGGLGAARGKRVDAPDAPGGQLPPHAALVSRRAAPGLHRRPRPPDGPVAHERRRLEPQPRDGGRRPEGRAGVGP